MPFTSKACIVHHQQLCIINNCASSSTIVRQTLFISRHCDIVLILISTSLSSLSLQFSKPIWSDQRTSEQEYKLLFQLISLTDHPLIKTNHWSRPDIILSKDKNRIEWLPLPNRNSLRAWDTSMSKQFVQQKSERKKLNCPRNEMLDY